VSSNISNAFVALTFFTWHFILLRCMSFIFSRRKQ